MLLAIRNDGSLKWAFAPPDIPPNTPFDHLDIYSSPAIGSDSTVYFGQEFGRVYAVNGVTGALRWMVETQTGITWSSPALTSDGTLLITDLEGRLYGITTDSRGFQHDAPWPRYRHDNNSSGNGGR